MANFIRQGIREVYIGAAADVKPTGVPRGSTAIEYDTGKEYITDDGTNWRFYRLSGYYGTAAHSQPVIGVASTVALAANNANTGATPWGQILKDLAVTQGLIEPS